MNKINSPCVLRESGALSKIFQFFFSYFSCPSNFFYFSAFLFYSTNVYKSFLFFNSTIRKEGGGEGYFELSMHDKKSASYFYPFYMHPYKIANTLWVGFCNSDSTIFFTFHVVKFKSLNVTFPMFGLVFIEGLNAVL